ncbi:hypothetical protein Tco_1320975 [Tanacetum coccineum]|uniref:RNA-directed DNA polymerase, eukaryota, nucleotide-binding alpha-beta plait domain protein n=1 Tax=Tanacetum coccineum TaxID=301880 RepID=A0ABQ5CCJ4_9ASTR
MAIGTGHRSNNYSESKRNDHLDNNRRQEQRNKGIPNKSHPNFREEHKSFSSIFVSNIPWNASVQDLWDICNKWISIISSNLRTAWMGGFHLFADVAKYGRTYNRPVEHSGDGKPSVGSNSQSVSINENVFQSFNSYAKAVLGNKSVDMSGKYGTSNAGAESRGCRIVTRASKNICLLRDSMMLVLDMLGDLGWSGNSTPMDKPVWSLPLANPWAPEVYKKLGVCGEAAVYDMSLAYRAPNIESIEVNSESNPAERKGMQRVPRMRDFVMNSVLYNDGVLRNWHGKKLDDDAGEILGVHSQVIVCNVTTDEV